MVAITGAIVGTALAGTFAGLATSVIVTNVLIATFIAAGSSIIAGQLRKGPRTGDPFSRKTVTVRQPAVARRVAYGHVRVGGVVTYYYPTTDRHRYVLTFCEGPIHSFQTIWIDGWPVAVSQIRASDGAVTSGRYAGKMWIRLFKGGLDQEASEEIWSNTQAPRNFHGRGIAYGYFETVEDLQLFPAGIPNISATVFGKLVDVNGTIRYSQNPADCLRDYLTSTRYGLGVTADRLDASAFASARRVCFAAIRSQPVSVVVEDVRPTENRVVFAEQTDGFPLMHNDFVTVSSTGTLPSGLTAGTVYGFTFSGQNRDFQFGTFFDRLTGARVELTSRGSGTISVTRAYTFRYTVSALIDMDQTPQSILQEFAKSMAGRVVHTGGLWKPVVGAPGRRSHMTLGPDDMRGGIDVRTRVPRRDRVNVMTGLYSSEMHGAQPTDYPAVRDTDAVTADGMEITGDLDIPFTGHPVIVQRIAKIHLAQARQEIRVSLTVSLRAVTLVAGSLVSLTFPEWEWDRKLFEVIEWRFGVQKSQDGGSVVVIDLQLKEHSESVYDWDHITDEALVDPAPAIAHQGASWAVDPVRDLVWDPDLSSLPRWTRHSDPDVTGTGGAIIVAVNGHVLQTLPGNSTTTTLGVAAPGTDETKTVTVRAKNADGELSDWSQVSRTGPSSYDPGDDHDSYDEDDDTDSDTSDDDGYDDGDFGDF